MKRHAMQDLIKWKSSEERKPMVLKGARQVGKTWLMKEFGQNYYENYVYFNFDEEDELKSIFETNKNPYRIIELLSLIVGEKILPGKTLIIFDEIQECPEALNTLKYFKEEANDYHVIAVGSLLGTLLAKPKSYPVGMVNLLDIYPLTFDEFLEAVEPMLYIYYSNIQKGQQIEDIFHDRLLEAYNTYLIIGGMPECVASWVNYKDPSKSIKYSANLSKFTGMTFQSTTVKSTVDVFLWSSVVVLHSLPNQMRSLCTEQSVRGAELVILRRRLNGLCQLVCLIVFIMSPKWSIRFMLLTNWISSNFLSLILDYLNTWPVLIIKQSF